MTSATTRGKGKRGDGLAMIRNSLSPLRDMMSLRDAVDRMFVVRATFRIADGSTMRGYITPPRGDDASIGTLQPIIVTDRGQVRFWCGTAAPGAKRLAHSYELLGKEAKQVFPVQFASDVELVGGPVTGSVPGFLVLEDFQTRRTRTIV